MVYDSRSYFPQGYQPLQAPYQLPYQAQMQNGPFQNGNPQNKAVEVVPVDTVEEAESCPMAAGSSLLFFARDDSFIAVKTIGVNGQSSFNVFDKRPPAPPAAAFDPSVYVRRDEIGELVAAAVAAQTGQKPRNKRTEETAE